MQGYGPITVTPGSVVQQTIDQSADRILLSNRSIYDVLVSFQVAQPVASSVLSPLWPVVVHAGDQVVYTLRSADRTPTPLGAYWQGNVWLCATAQQSGLALGGTGSSSSQFWITGLHPGDPTPTLAARPTWVDASSQARVVTIPAPVMTTFYQAHSVAGANLYSINYGYAQRTTPAASFYLHWLTCMINTANATCDFQIGPIGYDANTAAIGNSFASMAEFNCIGIGTTALMFPMPLVIQQNFGTVYGAQVYTYAGFGVKVIGVGASSFVAWSMGISIDIVSGETVGDIGGGAANHGNPIF